MVLSIEVEKIIVCSSVNGLEKEKYALLRIFQFSLQLVSSLGSDVLPPLLRYLISIILL